MLKQVYEVTEQGLIREIYVAKLDEQGNILYLDSFDVNDVVGTLVIVDLHSGLYKPKWNGTGWEEGETAEEKAIRESQDKLNNLNPSPEAVKDAEIEVKVLTLLLEMGVIQ